MRHQLSGRQLSRNAPHRAAMLRNMAASLLRHDGDMGEFTIARQWQDRAARIVS